MSDSLNPYAPPTASLEPVREGVWRDGKSVVLRPGSPLPPRCFKCNAPVETPAKKRKVYWHHPALYLLVLVNILIYAIVALIVRKKAEVDPALCPAHAKRRWMANAGGWIGVAVGIALAILGGSQENCGVMGLGAVVFLAAIVAAIILARVVYPERITTDFVRLRGGGRDFLDSLPEFPG